MKHTELFKIHIPEPCHEDWSKMTQDDKGKFCHVCSKTVVDFSNQSEEQINQYVLANSHQRICGRFKKEQLFQPEQFKEQRLENKIVFKLPSWLFPINLTPVRSFTAACMIFASVALSSCGNSEGRGDGERLAGAIAWVDSTNNTNDTTCNIKNNDDEIFMGKIKPKIKPKIKYIERVDTLKADTSEIYIKGDIEPREKMGIIQKVEDKK